MTSQVASIRPLADTLVENLKAGKPLLDGAQVFRGTRLPDQARGTISDEVMHGSLSLQVAAQYTQNHDGGSVGYIGVYPLDRGSRFHSDWGLEKALSSEGDQGLSVDDAEAMLRPHAQAIARAATPEARLLAERELEKFVQQSLYETSVQGPALAQGRLHYYLGAAQAHSAGYVAKSMTGITASNDYPAREAMLAEYRTPATETLRKLARVPVNDQHLTRGEVAMLRQALNRIAEIGMDQAQANLRDRATGLSLSELIKEARKPDLDQGIQKLVNLAGAMKEAAESPNKQHQVSALAAAKALGSVPREAGYRGLISAIAAARTAPAPTQARTGAAPTHQADQRGM